MMCIYNVQWISGAYHGVLIAIKPHIFKMAHVSLWLASICWTKSLLCNNAFKQGFSYFQSLLIQSYTSRRFCTDSKLEKSNPLHLSRRRDIPFGCSTVKHHLSGRWELSIWTFLCVEKLQTALGCIRPDVSATRSDAFQCSTSQNISF